MPTTSNFSLRYPDATFAVNVPNDMSNLASDVDTVLLQLHRSTAQGDAGSSADGSYTGAVHPTFTNTLATLGIIGCSFIAPRAGKVRVHYNVGQCRNSGVGGSMVFDFTVQDGSTLGSGTTRRAANSRPSTTMVAVSTAANENKSGHGFDLVTGLTAGNTYNACIAWSATGGTTTVNRPTIMVEPAN